MKQRLFISTLIALAIAGCATTSGVMEMEGGTFTVSSFAAPIRGGAAGAVGVAYEEAKAHCAKSGKRAVVVDQGDRDVYVSAASAYSSGQVTGNANSINGNYRSGGGGATMAAGKAQVQFRCVGSE